MMDDLTVDPSGRSSSLDPQKFLRNCIKEIVSLPPKPGVLEVKKNQPKHPIDPSKLLEIFRRHFGHFEKMK